MRPTVAARPAWSLVFLTLAFASLLAPGCDQPGVEPPPPPPGDGGLVLDLAAPPAADLAAPADLARDVSGTYTFVLDAGAFAPSPPHPGVLVYIPHGFDPTPPLHLVVFLHGWSNCVENVVRDAGQSCDPAAGTPARSAFGLAAQLEASGKNAILVVPELSYDKQSSAPGNLAAAGGFRALLAETLRNLAPQLGPVTPADVGTVVLASHSGGYIAAAGIATVGGVPVDELYLLDSLYGNFTDYDTWVKSDLASFHGASPARRFADVYTAGGGTFANSQAMASRAATWFPADAGVIVDDRTTSTWPPATYEHGQLYKLSGLTHDGVVRYYFQQLVQSSRLPAK